jgi:hypothetical protein
MITPYQKANDSGIFDYIIDYPVSVLGTSFILHASLLEIRFTIIWNLR